jgi:hypothetical protein
MTPMRAIIVGPPSVATRIKAFIAACYLMLGLGKERDVIARHLQGLRGGYHAAAELVR